MPKNLRAEARAKIPALQNDRCVMCGLVLGPRKRTGMGGVHSRGWNVDHVWPRARYDYAHRGNLLVSHTVCNERKGDRDPTGCEVVMLMTVNLRLGWKLETREVIADRQAAAIAKRDAAKAERIAAHEVRQAALQERRRQRETERRIAYVRRRYGPDTPVHGVDVPFPVPTRAEAAARPPVLWQLDALVDTLAGLYGSGDGQ